MTCRLFLTGAHGVKARLFFFSIFFLVAANCFANTPSKIQLEDDHCAYGSHNDLYNFFTEKNYVVIAQGKRIQPTGKIKDFADVLLLVSPDMAYFHAVTLAGIKYDYFKACIFTTAREIDFQFASPIPNLLERKNREHLVFLINNLPKDTPCPTENTSCMSWSEWSPLLKQTFILSAYTYSSQVQYDPYNEIVELTIDNKTITPTRGVLAEHARVKYAIRLRNELNESTKDLRAAKDAYVQIHNEVDHKLPLVFLSVTENRNWNITQINRNTGLAETVIHGIELELYPMKSTEYKKLLEQ